MTIQWAGLPAVDPFAGTPYARKPMPDDETLIRAIQAERGDLRRVAWELGDLDQEELFHHILNNPVLRPVYLQTQGRYE